MNYPNTLMYFAISGLNRHWKIEPTALNKSKTMLQIISKFSFLVVPMHSSRADTVLPLYIRWWRSKGLLRHSLCSTRNKDLLSLNFFHLAELDALTHFIVSALITFLMQWIMVTVAENDAAPSCFTYLKIYFVLLFIHYSIA